MNELIEKGIIAQNAARELAVLSTEKKNNALLKMAQALIDNCDYIIEQNKIDLDNADIKPAMRDRLMLNKERIESMADGIREIVDLPDPIGEVLSENTRPNGLVITKKRVPIGVIGIIYEARPNVTSDASALCLKSGNVAFLRGGSEAIMSNRAIVKVLSESAKESGLPDGVINLVCDVSRETANKMMKLNDYIDVLIPRGGKGLIKTVVENSTVPVIETGSGVCHTYVAKSADLKMAENIVINAKVSRPSVCNAMETLLIDKEIANEFLPLIKEKLIDLNVEVRGCEKCLLICPDLVSATDEDWSTEYNDYILSVKIVDGVDEAISHISRYSTKHSEAIITTDVMEADKFTSYIDSAAVYVNASTRFTDGNEFGLGAEIGISTQKIHARGPMGLNELTSIKYIVSGNGQIRE